ncbi:MAG: beta-N-acetylhexosaminidase [Rhodospirillales bacterium]|nr:beta-N-acetylhexosaminidase [Rhodospirillales bacterium]
MICGLSGLVVTPEERDFFRDADPLGFILFARNCDNPDQVKALCASLHEAVGREAPILIDQEGGRVQRLKAPHGHDYPAAHSFGRMFLRDFAKGRDALRDSSMALARELAENGVTVNCAPVMDVLFPETHDVIGDRAYDSDPEVVAALGSVVCAAFLEQGIIPIIKHLPGHGRACSDSHEDLPVVDASLEDLKNTDFKAFRDVMNKSFSEALWGMTAHVVYKAVDDRLPTSCSRKVIYDVIREDINFDGLLLSDDVSMGALGDCGDIGARTDMVLRAGCDIVLHCNGDMAEMKAVAANAEKMTKAAVMRYNRSVSWVKRKVQHG